MTVRLSSVASSVEEAARGHAYRLLSRWVETPPDRSSLAEAAELSERIFGVVGDIPSSSETTAAPLVEIAAVAHCALFDRDLPPYAGIFLDDEQLAGGSSSDAFESDQHE